MSYAYMTIYGLIAVSVYLAAWTLEDPICEGVKNNLFILAN